MAGILNRHAIHCASIPSIIIPASSSIFSILAENYDLLLNDDVICAFAKAYLYNIE
ncbi:hypothetical protein JCM19296_297 [Nonlabens ulvanivorans]|uniref:Uncharacterized protein n=1 Tax=Nonlabens ulvanivorans TaxID=906888 RepID=A0A081D723_NONUL|nr:hypothetical protein JCM19296_297 [Nonlabens ulvanivorans]